MLWYNVISDTNHRCNYKEDNMKYLQKLGRSLMQPVAVLPLAAILLGLGYAIDPSGWGTSNALAAFLIKSGGAIIDNLPIIFAVGVAYGMSKDSNGAAALSGLVAFLTITTLLSEGTVTMLRNGEAPLAAEGFGVISNTFIGILSGAVAAEVYNKFSNKKLPDALAFFSGRRMTPIVTSFVMIVISGVLYYVWPMIYSVLVSFGEWMVGLGPWGAGIYGFFNRLLIPTGLHHALNSVFWFDIAGIKDIPNFLGGAEALKTGAAVKGVTGMYQAGFFPIMMFGLPGAALAIIKTAKPERRKEVSALMMAGILATVVTGLTEPIEFSFMFLAPGLYLLHAILSGISLTIAALLQSTAGFGFSAGLIDYLLSLKNPVANKPLLLMAMGVVTFFVYYFLFKVLIEKFNLKTPGRNDEATETEGKEFAADTDYKKMAETILAGVGGKENVETLHYCITRLRFELKDETKVNENQIKSTGISGIVRPSKNALQVIVGTQVQFVYDAMMELMNK